MTQAEGIKDLIDAETEEQRKSAVRVVGVGEGIFASPLVTPPHTLFLAGTREI